MAEYLLYSPPELEVLGSIPGADDWKICTKSPLVVTQHHWGSMTTVVNTGNKHWNLQQRDPKY